VIVGFIVIGGGVEILAAALLDDLAELVGTTYLSAAAGVASSTPFPVPSTLSHRFLLFVTFPDVGGMRPASTFSSAASRPRSRWYRSYLPLESHCARTCGPDGAGA